MRFWRHLTSALLLGPLIGCIALVPSYEPTEHCEFAGDTECAKCLRTSCQTEIDACCGVSSCHESSFLGTTGTTIGAVDTCARGGGACATELDYATKTPEGEAVRVCVQSTCKTQCAIATKWTCEAPRTETAPCAACIYSKCNAQITECCGKTSSCAKFYGIEDDLSTCISGDEAACAYRLKEGAEAPEERAALRKCMREDCATVCQGDGSFHRKCQLQSGGTYCVCSDAAATSGEECSKTTVKNGRCYEASGGCVCGHFACRTRTYTTTTGGSYPECTCDLGNTEEGGEESELCNFDYLGKKPPGDDPICCLSVGASVSCTCNSARLGSSCGTGGTPVPSCDRDYLLNTKLKPYATDVCSK